MQLITSALTAFFLIKVFMLPYRHEKLNRKPFNCIPCLSFWLFLVSLVSWQYTEWFFLACSAGSVGALWVEIYNRTIE